VTWDKYVDTARLAKIDNKLFCEEITVNGKQYNLFEGEKEFSCTIKRSDNESDDKCHKFNVRRIYIWNRSCNRRTCGLAWTGDLEVDTAECVRAILNRWGASENTFKHLKDRHPFHYHPGFKLKESKNQEISNPEIKKKQFTINRIRKRLNTLYKKISKAKDILNSDGTARKNSAKEKLKREIADLEVELKTTREAKKELPEKINVSGLEDYKSFNK
jgi:hypothetical protein